MKTGSIGHASLLMVKDRKQSYGRLDSKSFKIETVKHLVFTSSLKANTGLPAANLIVFTGHRCEWGRDDARVRQTCPLGAATN